MYNELFSIGPLTFYGYGLMIAIGIISAYLSAEYRAKKMGLKHELIFSLTIAAGVSGILGAKLMYIIVELPNIIKDPSILLDVTKGFVVYGGIILGVLGGYIFCRVKKLVFLDYFDLAMPSIALAQGFGRIGCFLAGCCYGKETTCAIGITFTNSDFAPNNIKLIPTQLLSSGLDFLHFFILLFFAKRKKVSGRVAALYLIFYSVGRFAIEFLRGDIDRGNVGNLSTSQFISIFTLIAGVGLFVILGIADKRKKAAALEEEEEEAEEEAEEGEDFSEEAKKYEEGEDADTDAAELSAEEEDAAEVSSEEDKDVAGLSDNEDAGTTEEDGDAAEPSDKKAETPAE